MFGFIKNQLQKIYSTVTDKIKSIFSKKTIDDETLKELEKILITADTGVGTTNLILAQLRKEYEAGKIPDGESLKKHLQSILIEILDTSSPVRGEEELRRSDVSNHTNKPIYLLVGINGSGKTTFAAKLAKKLLNEKKKVLLVAADTFRAAAVEQLKQWAQKLKVDMVIGKENQDPAAVVFAGCQKYKSENYDALIIDTSGRLQTKVNLMKELEKIKSVILKHFPENNIITLLTVDAMLGQNSFEQAKIFNESVKLNGIALTKMDGTGKGGIVFHIAQELKLPVAFISYGEKEDQLMEFDPKKYVEDLLNA